MISGEDSNSSRIEIDVAVAIAVSHGHFPIAIASNLPSKCNAKYCMILFSGLHV